jgi:hypothetical protein
VTSSVKEEPIQLTDAAYLPFPAKCKLCLKPPSIKELIDLSQDLPISFFPEGYIVS